MAASVRRDGSGAAFRGAAAARSRPAAAAGGAAAGGHGGRRAALQMAAAGAPGECERRAGPAAAGPAGVATVGANVCGREAAAAPRVLLGRDSCGRGCPCPAAPLRSLTRSWCGGSGQWLPPAPLPGLSPLWRAGGGGRGEKAYTENSPMGGGGRAAAVSSVGREGRREGPSRLVPGRGGPCAGEAGPHRRAAPWPGLGKATLLQRWTERGAGLREGEGISELLINPACWKAVLPQIRSDFIRQ